MNDKIFFERNPQRRYRLREATNARYDLLD